MPVDPRLRDVQLLTLAAYRIQQRRHRHVPDWRTTEGLSALLEAARHLPRREPFALCPTWRSAPAWRGSWLKPGSGRRSILVATDPRLAHPVILALAARRAKQRQQAEPRQTVTMQVVYYDARGIEPDELGESYVYELPAPGDRPC
jgi:hypothetical protein